MTTSQKVIVNIHVPKDKKPRRKRQTKKKIVQRPITQQSGINPASGLTSTFSSPSFQPTQHPGQFNMSTQRIMPEYFNPPVHPPSTLMIQSLPPTPQPARPTLHYHVEDRYPAVIPEDAPKKLDQKLLEGTILDPIEVALQKAERTAHIPSPAPLPLPRFHVGPNEFSFITQRERQEPHSTPLTPAPFKLPESLRVQFSTPSEGLDTSETSESTPQDQHPRRKFARPTIPAKSKSD